FAPEALPPGRLASSCRTRGRASANAPGRAGNAPSASAAGARRRPETGRPASRRQSPKRPDSSASGHSRTDVGSAGRFAGVVLWPALQRVHRGGKGGLAPAPRGDTQSGDAGLLVAVQPLRDGLLAVGLEKAEGGDVGNGPAVGDLEDGDGGGAGAF